MMRLVLRIVEFGWQGPRQGPRVMEGLRLRDASYSRHSPRPSATAGKKLRHFGKKKKTFAARSTLYGGYMQLLHRVMSSPPQVDFF